MVTTPGRVPRKGDSRCEPQDLAAWWFLSTMELLEGATVAIQSRRDGRNGHDTGESGQTLVLLVVLMTVLLGVSGLVVDGGNWLVNRRELQNAADAAALAGASKIPSGTSQARDMANAQYADNGLPSDSLAVSNTTYQVTDDSVTVTATRNVDTFFTTIFGLDSVTETATAQATVESFTTINGVNAMPWGVLQGTYVPGQPYSIYTKTTANANNGALSLPYVAGANCPIPSGANVYEDEITGDQPVCPITLGETLETKPGDNSGPTAQGLNTRITNWQTADQIVDFTTNPATVTESKQPPARAHPRAHQSLRGERLAKRHQQPHDGRWIRLLRGYQLRRPRPSQLLQEQRRQASQRCVCNSRQRRFHRHQWHIRPQS